MDGRQQSVVPCPHRPPVKSLSELFEISKIQCEWMELYARAHRYTMKKPIKQNHRLAVTCVRATETDYNKAVIVVDEIAEYFGIEEGRMKVRCNRTVNGVTLIRSSFPGEFCPNYEKCKCFILRQLDQEKFRNLWWLSRLIETNSDKHLQKIKTKLLSLHKDDNPYSTAFTEAKNKKNEPKNRLPELPSETHQTHQPSQHHQIVPPPPVPSNPSPMLPNTLEIPTKMIFDCQIPGFVNQSDTSFAITPLFRKNYE